MSTNLEHLNDLAVKKPNHIHRFSAFAAQVVLITEKDDVSTSGVVINQTLDDNSWPTYVKGLDGAEPWVKCKLAAWKADSIRMLSLE